MIKNLKKYLYKNNYIFFNRIIIIAAIFVIALIVYGFSNSSTDYFLKISRSIDLFGNVFREVTANYVEEIDPEIFVKAGINGMLGSLDPYTNFIDEKEIDEVQLITSGTYGGIGVTVGLRDGFITIIGLMEGYSAQRLGVQPGDRVLEVDGKPTIGMKPDELRTMTRGEPGTEVRLKIERDGEPQPLDFVLVREIIQLKNITFADYIDNGIAYIRLERFTTSAGDELRLALKELKLKGDLKGIILDLRGNPGGLLESAVDVVEKFVDKGNLVVSTKGRTPDSEKKYFANEEPVVPNIPLIVLINKQSASASEIVAGAIQDLDRGLIVGTRSFGKGLVQTVMPLLNNNRLKITTARYYTPSGRCIQEIDYQNKTREGIYVTTPDSMKREFRTLRGRLELEGGGITPDSTVPEPERSALYDALMRRSMFFRFATYYSSIHSDVPEVFNDEILLVEFKKFLDSLNFSYNDEFEVKLKELCDAADKCKYSKEIKNQIEQLKSKILSEKVNVLDRYKEEILTAIKPEIVSRSKGQKGLIETSLKEDVQVRTALGLLKDRDGYAKRLNPN